MSLNIKNAVAERMARQLAAVTGENVTQAISVAIRERLERVQSDDEAAREIRARRIREIAADAAGRWCEPYRSTDHDALLYDSVGLPR